MKITLKLTAALFLLFFAFSCKKVKVSSLKGLDKLKEDKRIKLLIPLKKVGDTVDPKLGLKDLLLFFHAAGKDHDELFEIFESAQNLLEYKFEEV